MKNYDEKSHHPVKKNSIMQYSPKISIITVCFNSEETIKDTIESVVSQKFSDYEHIICDGGSTDNTINILDSSSHSKLKYVSEPDDGLYDAMNKSIALAQGEYIGFLNSDDVYSSNEVLSIIGEHLNENVDAIYGDINYTKWENLEIVTRKWKSKQFKTGDMMKGWMPAHPTFYCKREILKKSGGFDLSLPISADYDLMLRLLEKDKIRCCYIDKILVHMREGGMSGGGLMSILKQNHECLKSRNKLRKYKLPIDLAFFLKPISKLKQFT